MPEAIESCLPKTYGVTTRVVKGVLVASGVEKDVGVVVASAAIFWIPEHPLGKQIVSLMRYTRSYQCL